MTLFTLLIVAPLALQALAMTVDELRYHRARGLGRWERIGHPLDTLAVLACVAWTLAASPTRASAFVYTGLAALSCLVITKDEAVHASECSPGEHWLHAVLFVLHPIALGALGLAWFAPDQRYAFVQAIAFGSVLAFGLYQTLYWNIPWRRRSPPIT